MRTVLAPFPITPVSTLALSLLAGCTNDGETNEQSTVSFAREVSQVEDLPATAETPSQEGGSGHLPIPRCETAQCCPPNVLLIEGSEGADDLSGGGSEQCVVGLGGPDILEGGGAKDVLMGGAGDDTLDAGGGDDVILAGAGDDQVDAGGSDDYIEGNAGDDAISGRGGEDVIVPGPGRDEVNAGGADDVVRVFDVCELEPGETLDGGSDSSGDTLYIPVPLAQAQAFGVTVENFETITQDTSQGEVSQCDACGCEIDNGSKICCSGHGECAVDPAESPTEFICDCAPGFTGDFCEIECVDGAACDATTFFTPAGDVAGLHMRGAAIDLVPSWLDSSAVAVRLRQWGAVHERTLRLPAITGISALAELVPIGKVDQFDGLALHTFEQTWYGVRIYGPEARVTVTTSTPNRILAFNGTLLDTRQALAGDASAAPTPTAEAIALAKAATLAGRNPSELTLGNTVVVAVPQADMFGWAFSVEAGLGPVASVVVGSTADEPVLAMARHVHATEAEVRATSLGVENPSVLPEHVYETHSAYYDGATIEVTTFTPDPVFQVEGAGDPRLGTAELPLVTLDERSPNWSNGEIIDLACRTPTSPDASFIETEQPDADVQNVWWFLTNTRRLVDLFARGSWDSLRGIGPLPGTSSFSPSDFAPAMVAFHGMGNSNDVCPEGAIACASFAGPLSLPRNDIRPRLGSSCPAGATCRAEPVSTLFLKPRTKPVGLHVLPHEVGHNVDTFLSPLTMGSGVVAPVDPQESVNECLAFQGTGVEAPALAETYAELIAQATLSRMYAGTDYAASWSMGRTGTAHETGSSIPQAMFSEDRPQAEDGNTGLCDDDGGYFIGTGIISLATAWWKWMRNQECTMVAPYMCDSPVPTQDNAEATAVRQRIAEAGMRALVFAADAGNGQSYEQFLSNMAASIDCAPPVRELEAGESPIPGQLDLASKAAFHSTLGHHRLPVPAQEFPMACCGNEIAQGAEACDANDLRGQSCGSLGFAEGELRCSGTCTLDTSACFTCGNGTVEADEVCDGGVRPCAELDPARPLGNATCDASCMWDTGACAASICGNGVIEGGEACDGSDFGGATCESETGSEVPPRSFGSLTCSNCQIETASCEACDPGTEGCRCKRLNEGESISPGDPGFLTGLYEGGVFGDGRYCVNDVSFGLATRCVDLLDGGDTCVGLAYGGGPWSRCYDAADCDPRFTSEDFVQVTTGFPTMECAYAHNEGLGEPVLTFGYCFATGANADEGGKPSWFDEAYCAAVNLELDPFDHPEQGLLCCETPDGQNCL